MKILVCFKTLPNPDGVLPEDFDNFTLSSDLSYAGVDYNCFDASALEIGLKIKEKAAVLSDSVTCTALSASSKISQKVTMGLYSVGYDKVVNIKFNNREFKPKETARLLSEYAKSIGADVILTGSVSGYAETGSVPYYIAENLDYPVISSVEKVDFKDDNIVCYCRCNGDLIEKICTAPLVLSVDNSPEVLRFATLKQRLSCKNKTEETVEIKNADEIQQKPIITRPKINRKCEFINTNNEKSFIGIKNIIGETLQKQSPEILKESQNEDFLCELKKSSVVLESSYNYGEDLDYFLNELKNNYKNLVILKNDQKGKLLCIKLSQKLKRNSFIGGKILDAEKNSVTLTKRVYASNLEWTSKVDFPAVITVDEGEFEKLKDFDIIKSKVGAFPNPTFIKRENILEKAPKGNLKYSKLVVICGSGMGSKDSCNKARLLAEKLGAGFGLTRPACLNAWGSPNEIVGQSGSIIKPECCLVLGASGAGAFMLGIENAKKIIAVNTDSNALIFKNADIGIKMDAKEFVEKMLSL